MRLGQKTPRYMNNHKRRIPAVATAAGAPQNQRLSFEVVMISDADARSLRLPWLLLLGYDNVDVVERIPIAVALVAVDGC